MKCFACGLEERPQKVEERAVFYKSGKKKGQVKTNVVDRVVVQEKVEFLELTDFVVEVRVPLPGFKYHYIKNTITLYVCSGCGTVIAGQYGDNYTGE